MRRHDDKEAMELIKTSPGFSMVVCLTPIGESLLICFKKPGPSFEKSCGHIFHYGLFRAARRQRLIRQKKIPKKSKPQPFTPIV